MASKKNSKVFNVSVAGVFRGAQHTRRVREHGVAFMGVLAALYSYPAGAK